MGPIQPKDRLMAALWMARYGIVTLLVDQRPAEVFGG